MPALDGVRALAVAVVFAYHAPLSWAPGGFLGVDVFFVLSGFLITSLLLADHADHGRIRLKRFWFRRARRLLPAVIALLVGISLAVALVASDQGWRLRGDLLAALGYVSNWRLIYQHQSYFQAIGRPPLVQHLWSLAVEEQFYLLWPLLLALALRFKLRRAQLGRLILVVAAASAGLMALLYDPTVDPSRVYYGTDTRAAALLVGAALACLWPRSPAASVSRRRSALTGLGLEAAGMASLVGLAVAVVRLDQFRPGLYRGGFLGVALMAAVLVAVGAAERPTLVGSLLARRPLVWLGRRSYAIYLWFWPVFMLTRPHADIDLTGYPLLALRAAITLALAAASYRYIEEPIRNGALGRVWNDFRHRRNRASVRRAAAWGLALGVAVVAVGSGVMVHRQTAPLPAFAAGGGGPHRVTAAAAGETDPVSAPAAASPPPSVAEPDTTSPPSTAPLPTDTVAPVENPAPAPADHGRVTAIGESVLLEAQQQLAAALGDLTVDAAVGRQVKETITAVRALKDGGNLGDEVILQVGNNGVVTKGEFDELMDLLSGVRRVAVVNVKVPRPWEGPNNEVIAAGVPRWPNAVLLDWQSIGSAHPDLFTSDGVHMQPGGVRLFTDLILSGL